MKIASGRVLDRLPVEEPCRGAVFTSYSFHPGFFEDHVLRAVLRLTSDPVEQAVRYHDEARGALQATPVVAIVDAGERRPGRRLPYDLLEVADVVFHPKSALLLYQEHARLLVGSGNLTFAGHGGNTELFMTLDLAYHDPADVALLRAYEGHLDRITAMARQRGSQMRLFRDELTRRMGTRAGDAGAATVALLDSTTAPIIEQLEALLPDTAVIESIGMLAPFYERDDGGDLDVTSVFGALAPRASGDAVLDIGVAWDNAKVYPDTEVIALEHGLHRLWAWAYQHDGARVIEHLVPTSIAARTLGYIDEHGRDRRWPLAEAVEAAERRDLWMQPEPQVFAPRHTIEAARARFADVRLWLHPDTRWRDGRPVHRPLHAKLLVVGFRHGRTRGTVILMGSANMSRRALLQKAGQGYGNVELGLAFHVAGQVSLRDLVPDLVFAPASAITVSEREFPALERNHALAIDEAVHDAAERTLTVTWTDTAANLPAWRLTYGDRELARSDAAPSQPIIAHDFVLEPLSAEVTLHAAGSEYPVPILVTDLTALPVTPAGPGPGLDELLMLLGRRIGAERAVQIAARQLSEGSDSEALAAFFGDGFGPTDVFRAWWSVAEDLGDAALSVPAFRLRLQGSLGAGAAWSRMLEAMNHEPGLEPAEVWFYGAELIRALGEVELADGVDRDAKRQVLTEFCAHVRADLATIELDDAAHPWLQTIRAFYREARP